MYLIYDRQSWYIFAVIYLVQFFTYIMETLFRSILWTKLSIELLTLKWSQTTKSPLCIFNGYVLSDLPPIRPIPMLISVLCVREEQVYSTENHHVDDSSKHSPITVDVIHLIVIWVTEIYTALTRNSKRWSDVNVEQVYVSTCINTIIYMY